jgi:hypothetical protein
MNDGSHRGLRRLLPREKLEVISEQLHGAVRPHAPVAGRGRGRGQAQGVLGRLP